MMILRTTITILRVIGITSFLESYPVSHPAQRYVFSKTTRLIYSLYHDYI